MMDRRTIVILVLACLAAAGGWWLQNGWASRMPDQPPAPADVKTFAVGDSVSGYTLPDATGQTTTLAKWHGKVVVLNFWASWCVPCIKEMPDISHFVAAHKNVRAIGLAYEDSEPADIKAFLAKHPVVYPIAQVTLDKPLKDFDAPRGLPMTYLIDPDGKVAKQKLGPVTEALLKQWIGAD